MTKIQWLNADSAKDKVAAHVRYICAEELERLVDRIVGHLRALTVIAHYNQHDAELLHNLTSIEETP